MTYEGVGKIDTIEKFNEVSNKESKDGFSTGLWNDVKANMKNKMFFENMAGIIGIRGGIRPEDFRTVAKIDGFLGFPTIMQTFEGVKIMDKNFYFDREGIPVALTTETMAALWHMKGGAREFFKKYLPKSRLNELMDYVNMARTDKALTEATEKKMKKREKAKSSGSKPSKEEESETESEDDEDEDSGDDDEDTKRISKSGIVIKYNRPESLSKGIAEFALKEFKGKKLTYKQVIVTNSDLAASTAAEDDFAKMTPENLQLKLNTIFPTNFVDLNLSILAAIAFDGMDMMTIATIFFKIGERKARNVAEDLAVINLWYLSRGSSLSEKALNSTDAKGLIIMRDLIATYGFVKNIESVSVSNKKTALTIARVIGFSPAITAGTIAKNMKNGSIKLIADSDEFGLPRYLRFPAAASLIPRTNTVENNTLKENFLKWSTAFSNVVRGGKPAWDNLTAEQKKIEVTKYFNAANGSQLIPDTKRAELLEGFKKVAATA